MIKNIIFDWSGTLSDDITPVYNATMNVFEKIGIKRLTFNEYKKAYVLPYMKIYHKFKKDVDKDEVDRIFLKEIHRVGEPKPFVGIVGLLENLKRKGIRMALLSSQPQKKLNKEIKDYKFRDFFIEADGSVYDKVEVIEGIMEKNTFSPDDTAYIGDTTHDIEAGKKAGVMTVAVTWGYQTKEQLAQAKPNYIADEIAEIKKIIFN